MFCLFFLFPLKLSAKVQLSFDICKCACMFVLNAQQYCCNKKHADDSDGVHHHTNSTLVHNCLIFRVEHFCILNSGAKVLLLTAKTCQ